VEYLGAWWVVVPLADIDGQLLPAIQGNRTRVSHRAVQALLN
jgi:hypothetical protein